jgi:hypothetical protein
MNPTQQQITEQDRIASPVPASIYEKPTLTTFGSIAKLTQGFHSAGSDGVRGYTKNRKT